MPNPVYGIRIDPLLIRAMKIRAIEEGRNMQEITTELYRAYLKKRKKAQPASIQAGKEGRS